jgi:hypothetical protein
VVGYICIIKKISPVSSDASLLSFLYNENKMKYEARSKEIVFSDVFPVKHINVPVVIEVEFFGDNNEVQVSILTYWDQEVF